MDPATYCDETKGRSDGALNGAEYSSHRLQLIFYCSQESMTGKPDGHVAPTAPNDPSTYGCSGLCRRNTTYSGGTTVVTVRAVGRCPDAAVDIIRHWCPARCPDK